jgi:hypothetical protein
VAQRFSAAIKSRPKEPGFSPSLTLSSRAQPTDSQSESVRGVEGSLPQARNHRHGKAFPLQTHQPFTNDTSPTPVKGQI